MSNQTSKTSIIRVAPIASLPKVRVFSLFAVAVMSTIILAGDAIGQGMAPVSPKFLEWQRRRAAETSAQAAAETNAPALRRAAAGESGEGFGLVPDVVDLDYLADINSGAVRAPVGGFPSSYDLREHGRLTAVRNQNPWGTCWAHATMASLESGILGREGVVTDFSENNMANLHGWDWGFDDGGNGTLATAYLVRWAGPANEADDPYANPGGSRSLSPVRHVQQVVWIPGKSDSLDNDAIKEAVMEHGALYVSYYHSSSYYKSSTASYYYPGGVSGNHAVAIVGWNDDYPASNFASTPAGKGAYLVRNSWGTGWGAAGYFWVSYYDGVFARSTMYSFRNAEPADNYSRIYQYDPLGRVSAFSASWGANLFTAAGADRIAAVGFYALAPRTSYSLYIYTGCQAGKPTSGACALTQTGTVSEPGFVTVPLNQAVSVASGSRFSVVLKLTTPGYGFPHAIEYAYTGITSGAAASSGQSFYSSSGSSWTDLTSWNSTANFCIKAYAAGASAAPALASISVSGPATVKSGETATYACSAKYSDTSEKAVTPRWSLPSGSAYASINSSGTLSAGETTIGRAIVIRAIYGENGVAKTNDWAVTITAAPPPAPSGLSATQGGETRAVRLSWNAVSVAENYAVYRGATASTANAQYLGLAESAKYSDTTAVPGRDYWYFVKARNGSGTGPFSEGANGWRALSAPDATASDGTSEDYVAVSWSPVEGAAAYMVWRSEDLDAEPTALSGWLSATEFADATAVPGTVYWYSVSAAVDATGLRPSGRGVPDDGFRAVPVVPEALAIDGDASIPAGGTASYSAYVLYSDGHRGESPTSPTWAVSTGSVSRIGLVTAPVVSANTELTLSASTTADGVHVTGTKAVTVTAAMPAAPANLRVVFATAAGGVSLAWDAVPGASGYAVARTADGAADVAFQTAVASFTDTAAIPGVQYAYSVAAMNAAGTGPWSAAVTATIPLAAPTGIRATIDRTDCVRVTWDAAAGATHYRVARATSADGAKTELGSWAGVLSYDDAAATAGTACWYFVKAATGASGDNAGPWSDGVRGMKKPARTLQSLAIAGPDRVPASGEAVYSCTAAYSDNTTETVSPSWSVSPATAGTIGADGRFAAAAVQADVTATITASFGGAAPATKSVQVVAPAAATAEITSVSAAQRWPFSGLVDIDYTLATTPAGMKAAVSVSAIDEDHNAVLPATTLSGDGADGRPVEAGSHRITWDLAADHPGFHAASLAVNLSAVPAESVTVTFDGNGGTPSSASITGFAGSPYGILPTASRIGCAFVGWFTAAIGGVEVTGTSLMDASVTTLYAHWSFTRQLYGATFENDICTTPGYLNDFAYIAGTQVAQYNGVEDGEAYGWISGEYYDATIIAARPDASGGQALKFSTEGSTLTNKLKAATSAAIMGAVEAGGTAYYEADVKFAPSDSLMSGLPEGTSENMLAIYAYAPDCGPTNLVVFHAFYDGTGVLRYTNEVFDTIIDTESFTRLRVEMRQIEAEGTPLIVFSVSVNGVLLTSSLAYYDGCWFLTTEGQASSSPRGTSAMRRAWIPGSIIAFPAPSVIMIGSFDSLKFKGCGYIDNICVGLTELVGETFTVTFDGNGGTPSSEAITGFAGRPYGELPGATRPDYTFAGWWTEASGGIPISADSLMSESVTILYAHWTANVRDKVQLWEGGPYWATTNVGAENPEDSGLYFWWGDTIGYRREGNAWVASDGSSSSFSFSEGNTPTYGKTPATLQSEGWTAGVLALEHDAAHAHWGGNWRMPTRQELDELNNNCDWTWTTRNGVNGYVVRGRDGYSEASIFLPAAGGGDGTSLYNAGSYGYYWSSVPFSFNGNTSWSLYFYSGYHGPNSYYRYYGRSVRPVLEATIGVTSIPTNVAATQGNASTTPLVTVSWTRPATAETVLRYEVYRSASTNETPELVATVMTTSYADTSVTFRQGYWYRVKAVYESKTSNFSAQAKGYWGDGCYDPGFNLMPLKSLLRGLDGLNTDGVISDEEMYIALNNPGIGGGIDGDPSSISDGEIDVLLRIQEFNKDKMLIENVLKDNYESIPFATMLELQQLSNDIKALENY